MRERVISAAGLFLLGLSILLFVDVSCFNDAYADLSPNPGPGRTQIVIVSWTHPDPQDVALFRLYYNPPWPVDGYEDDEWIFGDEVGRWEVTNKPSCGGFVYQTKLRPHWPGLVALGVSAVDESDNESAIVPVTWILN